MKMECECVYMYPLLGGDMLRTDLSGREGVYRSTRLENRVPWVRFLPEQLIFLWKKELSRVLCRVVLHCLCCLV